MDKVIKDGLINAVSKEKKAFTLKDNTSKWYSSFNELNIEKGNIVSFELIEVEKNDKKYYNCYNLKVLKEIKDKKVDAIKKEIYNDRLKIDAGNCLRMAVDLSLSMRTELHETSKNVLKEFKYAMKSLSDDSSNNEPEQVDSVDSGLDKDGYI